MKRTVVLLVALVIIFPLFVLAETKLSFTPVGRGPIDGELAFPVTVIPYREGIACLDGGTGRVSIFAESGRFIRAFKLPMQVNFGSVEAFSDPSFALLALRFSSLTSDTQGNFYLLTKTNITKIAPDGRKTGEIGDLTLIDAVSMTTRGDKIYILDKNDGVLVWDMNGKKLKAIGQIGSGKGKVSKPINFWVDNDENVIILDSQEMFVSDENLVVIYNKNGEFIREFGPVSSFPVTSDQMLTNPLTGNLSYDNLYLLDIDFDMETNRVYWVIKNFKTNGDFEQIIQIPVDDTDIIKTWISSLCVDSTGRLIFAFPMLSKIIAGTGNEQVEISGSKPETLTIPISATTLPNGKTLVLEAVPARLHVYDSKGVHEKVVPIIPKDSALPGVNFNVATDVVFGNGQLLVATGFRVLKLNPDSFEINGSYELPLSFLEPSIAIAVAAEAEKVYVLDSLGQVTTFSEGLPSSFDAKKPLQASYLTDITVDSEGNIFVLDTQSKVAGVFDSAGTLKQKINLDVDIPTSIAVSETGELVVTDAGSNSIKGVTQTGKVVWDFGEKGGPENFSKPDDYMVNPGKFSHPTRIRYRQDQIFTILDAGNLRVQIAKSDEPPPPPPPPDKKPAKLAVSPNHLDFGALYYNRETELELTIKNEGEQDLTGNVTVKSELFKAQPGEVISTTKTVKIKVSPEKRDAWKDFKEGVIIETNGGTIEIPLTVKVVGKVVKMTVGSNDFVITTDGPDEVYKSKTSPQIISGKTYVPLRSLGEALGAQIEWFDKEKKVTYELEGTTVELWLGKKEAKVNGKPLTLDSPPLVIKGSTYVPVRFVSEQLGAKVDWIASSKTAMITYPAP